MQTKLINYWIWFRNQWNLFGYYLACDNSKYMFDKPKKIPYK